MRKLLAGLCIGLVVAMVSGCASSPTSESTGQYIDSSRITTDVKTALFAAKDVNSSDISVKTFKSIVQLSGFVNSPAQVKRAGEIASKVSGVTEVRNDLLVK